jgi:protein SCO1
MMLTNKKTLVWLLATLFIILLLSSLAARVYLANKETSRDNLAALDFYQFEQPRILAAISLRNLAGEEKPLAQHLSGWRIVNTGYLSCPDICPINLSLLNTLVLEWSEQAGVPPINVLHLTFDPKRDTPELLKSYLEFMNPNFYGLTGEVDAIQQVMQQLNMVFIHEKPDKYGNYFITHSDSMALINPQGQYIGLFKGPYVQTKMLQVLRVLLLSK